MAMQSNKPINLDSYEWAIRQDTDMEKLQLPMFNVLKATLQMPIDVSDKALKLSEDIRSFCKAEDEGANFCDAFKTVWEVYFGIVRCIQPHHPWFHSMGLCLSYLVASEGPISRRHKSMTWKDVSCGMDNLLVEIFEGREVWVDWRSQAERIWKRMNLISFIACISAGLSDRPPTFAVWALRDALEEPPVDGFEMNDRLWEATEWLSYIPEMLYEYMTTEPNRPWADDHAPSDDEKASFDKTLDACYKRGPLVGEVESVLSISRWNFWKKRFAELAKQGDQWALDVNVVKRLENAVEDMEEAETTDWSSMNIPCGYWKATSKNASKKESHKRRWKFQVLGDSMPELGWD